MKNGRSPARRTHRSRCSAIRWRRSPAHDGLAERARRFCAGGHHLHEQPKDPKDEADREQNGPGCYLGIFRRGQARRSSGQQQRRLNQGSQHEPPLSNSRSVAKCRARGPVRRPQPIRNVKFGHSVGQLRRHERDAAHKMRTIRTGGARHPDRLQLIRPGGAIQASGAQSHQVGSTTI